MTDQYWNDVYVSKEASERSWTQDSPTLALSIVDGLGLRLDDPILDVGAGASNFLDELIARGFIDLTALDISAVALDEARQRLGPGAAVQWIANDVTTWEPERQYALWRDRATFHFLTDVDAQRRYLDVARRAIRADGYWLLSTFSPEGPETCSGLPVRRWSTAALLDFAGDAFSVEKSDHYVHVTPWGAEQPFNLWLLRPRAAEPSRSALTN
ncbi:MAG TPA: class I SAM-dependent methyltransferase [Acidimicrobiales bacterium]|nr:class I SAM-dependent methyltransferase [Acidimicrobiales bacterium]